MHIINAMFSRGLGGIEQSFVDYCQAIKNQGHKVTAIIHPNAEIRPALVEVGVNIINVKNFGHWDIFAKSYLKKILKQTRPDAIIAHGNRAVELLKSPARKFGCPIIGVTHNYKLKRQIGLDAMFATTEDLRQKLLELGQDERTIYKVPNMIRLNKHVIPDISRVADDRRPNETYERGSQENHSQDPRSHNLLAPSLPLPRARGRERVGATNYTSGMTKPTNTPPVIGTMGRFVKKKGFDVFIEAVGLLDIPVQAVIGGGGEEEESLKQIANNKIDFIGWVTDKRKFFNDIDIFVLPSHHEPFGIILLEAFAAGKPVVTTDSEGPSEIATDGVDALVVPKGDAAAMTEAIKKLLDDAKLAEKLAKGGIQTVKKYDLDAVGKVMCEALEGIVNKKI